MAPARAGRRLGVLLASLTALVVASGVFIAAPASALPRSWVTASLSPTATSEGKPVTVSGTVAPRGVRTITVQRYYAGTWQREATARSTSTGAYSVRLIAPVPGTWTYRVRVEPSTTRAATYSIWMKLTVPPAAGPHVLTRGGTADRLYLVPLAGQVGGSRLTFAGGRISSWTSTERGLFGLVEWRADGTTRLVSGRAGGRFRRWLTSPPGTCFGSVSLSDDERWLTYWSGGTPQRQPDGTYGCAMVGSRTLVALDLRSGARRTLLTTDGSTYGGDFWPGSAWVDTVVVLADHRQRVLIDPATGAGRKVDLGALTWSAVPERLPTPAGTLAVFDAKDPSAGNGQWLVHLDGTPPTRNTSVVLTRRAAMTASPSSKLATWSAPGVGGAGPNHLWVGAVTGAGARDYGSPAGSPGTKPIGWAGDDYVAVEPVILGVSPIWAAVTRVSDGARVYATGQANTPIRGVNL